ncbi:MAG: hypothetical protein Q4B45_01760 [Coriobacteriia bacterium]|nr:hypothetical protein [Coriobacteriia bacterium]
MGRPRAKSTGARRPARAAASAALSAAIVLTGLGLAPATAGASTLSELQEQIDSCSASFHDATTRANELQDQIAANEERIAQIEDELPAKREAASKSIRTMYKLQASSAELIELLLSSESFEDVVSTAQYFSSIVMHNNSVIEGLVSASDELAQTRSSLAAEKAQVDEELSSALESLGQANEAREQYEAQLAAEAQAAAEKAAAEAAAAAEAQAAADAAAQESGDGQSQESIDAASQQGSGQDSSASGTGSASGDGASSSSGSSTGSSSSSDSSSSSSSTQEVETDGEWMSGIASAYDIEDNTGGTATASGIPLTHDSMTVAVPVSQSYLLGRTVQIRYAGKTITATVTDTGGFASYGRVLDLAGGCWQAFGFSSADDWGVRAVQYRFL